MIVLSSRPGPRKKKVQSARSPTPLWFSLCFFFIFYCFSSCFHCFSVFFRTCHYFLQVFLVCSCFLCFSLGFSRFSSFFIRGSDSWLTIHSSSGVRASKTVLSQEGVFFFCLFSFVFLFFLFFVAGLPYLLGFSQFFPNRGFL